jgi:hypothetical protein
MGLGYAVILLSQESDITIDRALAAIGEPKGDDVNINTILGLTTWSFAIP